MTPDERVAELRLLLGPLEIDFPLVHERIEELVGRPVWTHEFGLRSQEEFEEMTRQRTCERPDLVDIVSLVPPNKETIIVTAEEAT